MPSWKCYIKLLIKIWRGSISPTVYTPLDTYERYLRTVILHLPVTGASISIIVFSDLSNEAPSLTMRNAAASSIRPSRIKCCFSISGRGLFVLWSHTSAVVNFRPGGNGTPAIKETHIDVNILCNTILLHYKYEKCIRMTKSSEGSNTKKYQLNVVFVKSLFHRL